MSNLSCHFPRLVALALAAAALAGCNSRQEKAQEAYAQYQAAVAAGDAAAARLALKKLVLADDSVADYWVELGKFSLQTGDVGGAYEAFSRAHELDRGNVQVLATLTQIALRTGNLPIAEQRVKELELLAPDDASVQLTYGYLAMRRGNFDEASENVEKILAVTPYDSAANALKARILVAQDKEAEAADLLRAQVEAQPQDEIGLRALQSIYELGERWADARWTAEAMLRLIPSDKGARAKLIEYALLEGDSATAVAATIAAIEKSDAITAEQFLGPWTSVVGVDAAPLLPGIATLAARSEGDKRWALTRFLARHERWADVRRLTDQVAGDKVAPATAVPMALHAAALAMTGDRERGVALLDKVLALDNGNRDALRGRALARAQAGRFDAAIEDGQKLVAADPAVGSSWLLLADIYRKADKPGDVRRTLWEGFHEVPLDWTVYRALRRELVQREGEAAGARLTQEFLDQRSDLMVRSFG